MFRAFNLSSDIVGVPGIERLAHAYDLEPGELQAQFEDVYPIAAGIYKSSSGSLGSRECWVQAFRRVCDRRVTHNHPVAALRVVLMRYLMLSGATSSGVEQNFSKCEQLFDGRRSGCSLPIEDDELRIVLGSPDSITDALLKQAAGIYRKHYGAPRNTFTKLVKFKLKDRCPAKVSDELFQM